MTGLPQYILDIQRERDAAYIRYQQAVDPIERQRRRLAWTELYNRYGYEVERWADERDAAGLAIDCNCNGAHDAPGCRCGQPKTDEIPY